MDRDHFASILTIKVAGVANAYMLSTGAACKEALESVYHSRTYEALEREETKLWHHSPLLLLDCLTNELNTNQLEFPDE